MTLEITDYLMRSDRTEHIAAVRDSGGWKVTWLPDRVLDHNQAITAMTLAEEIEHPRNGVDGNYGLSQWKLIESLAAELDIPPLRAVHMVKGEQ